MSELQPKSQSLAAWSWLALIALQPVWHWLLPAPHGTGSAWLALLATAPLLLPARGVWQGSLRSMTWAGYLAMLYFCIGVMEAWSNPPQRLAALAQVLFVVVFTAAVFVFSRKPVPADR